ncbi:hypothetical protein GGD81_001166 [Rhodobium orientis]|uniref:Uncharacterized protein n=1 Tax=Rhodobium orientis TaxID=34017 RepID=A0A327JLP2_9HYPH|nr:hypothetical protein [Rhodobium orientis]MBB4302139.1 hypothetical protein [Rhodobium orientis]MBK5948850.1 hypothetical protein [Rhodobium orientis]RAI23221.1 hypothetical protein CH339_23150 [Rhodobium orientis]
MFIHRVAAGSAAVVGLAVSATVALGGDLASGPIATISKGDRLVVKERLAAADEAGVRPVFLTVESRYPDKQMSVLERIADVNVAVR